MTDVPVTIWEGAYDSSWRDLIVPAAFAHPAKMSRALLERIITHLYDLGAVERESLVLDPFGGIGTTAIIGASHGLRVICCELEPKFVDLARQNIEKWRRDWEAMGLPQPIVIQGDSRYLRTAVSYAAAIVSSPPYNLPMSQDHNGARGGGRGTTPSEEGAFAKYGSTEGQLEGLSMDGGVEAVISSPPYATGGNSHTAKNIGAQESNARVKERYPGWAVPSFEWIRAYGTTEGQMGILKEGDVEAVVSSPPYVSGGHHRDVFDAWNVNSQGQGISKESAGYGKTDGQIGQLDEGSIDAIITSPPYVAIASGAGGLNTKPPQDHKDQQTGRSAESPSQVTDQKYGDSDGQMAKMTTGAVDAVVTSPPYWKDRTHSENQADIDPEVREKLSKADLADRRYGDTEGQLGELPSGAVDAVVSSPPFLTARSDTERSVPSTHGGPVTERHHTTQDGAGYGDTPGNLETFKSGEIDAVVSSPPWERTGTLDHEGQTAKLQGNFGKGGTRFLDNRYAAESPGQIGSEQGETFWTAANQVVSETFALLKPGGFAVWVVKAFVRDKKLVDFPGDWRRLCEHAGFITIQEVHASLVQETTHAGLFGDRTVKKERKSFFRRLAEKKGSPKIDYEVVWVMRKPA